MKKIVFVSILKNGEVVHFFMCYKKDLQKTFNRAVNIAGGMYNGVDEFEVKVQ